MNRNKNCEGYYSILFLRPKPRGECWPIIDLKDLNQIFNNSTFRMESARSIQKALQQGMCACSIDLTYVFYHIPTHSNFRKLLRFAKGGKVYHFVNRSFGLVTTSQDIHLGDAGNYKTPEVTRDLSTSQIMATLNLLDQLGLIVNLKKSNLTAKHWNLLECFTTWRRGVLTPHQNEGRRS